MRLRLGVAASGLLWCTVGSAAESDRPPVPPSESVETMPVYGEAPDLIDATESWDSLSPGQVKRSDARSVADVIGRAPGALVQTNSRGETLVYLRNAGDRQVSVFLDDAPLNVPWDHRLDLGLIPGLSVETLEVARGPLSNRYGPNVAGGAVFIESPSPRVRRSQLVGSEGGWGGLWRVEGLGSWSGDRAGVVLGAEHMALDGQPVADSATLPFSQSGELRTNTDARRTSVLGRAAADVGAFDLSLTTLFGASRLGVAPESHLDPTVDAPRYWRYPDSSVAMAIASATGTLEGGFGLKGTAWFQAFDQTIESYADPEFAVLESRQSDANRSGGARTEISRDFGAHHVVASGLASYSRHREAQSGRGADTFTNLSYSTGLDHGYTRGRLHTRVGLGIDGLRPLETAGREATDFLSWNATAGARVDLDSFFSLRVAAGSRARLPTMRELFGVALNRFVPNADLQPERNTTVEVGASWDTSRAALEAIGFVAWTDDTIVQEITDDGVSRRRVNLDRSQVFGVELIGRATLLYWLVVRGHLLASRVEGRDAVGGSTLLAERPEFQAFTEVVLGRPSEGAEFVLEGFARARAYSVVPEGFVELPDSIAMNARVGFSFPTAWGVSAQAFARVDNLFDTEVVPQLGLPSPGRWLRAGVSAEF